MKTLIYCIFSLFTAYSASYFRLSTNENTKLNVGDSLISTLGYFQATLQKQNCSLQVKLFNETSRKYERQGTFKSTNFVADCQYLQIIGGMVRTNDNYTYVQVHSDSYNESTIFTIDDQGEIRLIGTYRKPNIVDLESTQVSFQTFKITPKYIRSVSQAQINFIDKFDPIKNRNKWQFEAQNGQMTISFSENPEFKTDYVYSTLVIRDSQILDFNGRTFPGAIFNNITYHPRCFGPRIYINYKPPFTFVADEYWPIFHLYEQGRYKIFQVAYSDLPQFDFEQNIQTYHFHRTYSPCPPRTFQYRGNCRATCPTPYYHEMRGQSGKCVLTCEQYTPRNDTSRVCECFTNYEKPKMSAKVIKDCPPTSKPSPYGCYCGNNEFYDDKYTFSCVTKCPQATFAKNGLCMQCPPQCTKCQIDNYKRNFLECKQCKDGYKVHIGQCVKECVSTHGLSLNNKDICLACSDKNCVDCSQNQTICRKCNILTTLRSGKCQNSCEDKQTAVYNKMFDTTCLSHQTQLCSKRIKSHYQETPFLKCDECPVENFFMHQDRCVNSCPTNYVPFYDKYCVCKDKLTIGNKCLDLKQCPIKMYFDIQSHSCLSCPFGCMTCNGNVCTSCNPGYYLYVAPQIIVCRRKSPLFPCDKQYELIRDTCVVKQFRDSRLKMRECVSNVPNCRVCLSRNSQICVMCDSSYLIFNNTCVKSCPKEMVKYQDSCILPQISNCEIPHLLSIPQSIVVTHQAMQDSIPYKHYTFNGNERGNDPVGYISYFQMLSHQKIDNLPRQTHFYDAFWICHKCKDGYGLSDDKKKCQPCPKPCINCYYAKNYSCLEEEVIDDNCGYIDTTTGKCVGSCTDQNKFPELSDDGKLYCKPILSSTTKDYLRIDSAIYPYDSGKGSFVFFIFGDKLTNLTEDVVVNQAKVEGTQDPSLVGEKKKTNVQFYNEEYIKIRNSSSRYYELNFTNKLHSVTSQNNLLFPNEVYGTYGGQLTHVQWMQTWLAYIGYILSIVIIILHIVFIGNQLLYKVDNTLIFIQTIFYFSYVKNLVGRLLAQFYFGWSFSHARFLPNFFQYQRYIPDGYIEDNAPVSYKLVNLDGNFIRNAGFSFSWMLLFMAIIAIICFVLWTISNLAHKKQSWNQTIAKQSLAAVFQFFSYNIIFFAITQLHFSEGADKYNQSYYERSQALAALCLCVYIIYTIVRFFYNVIGALYMVKRFLLATILMSAYNNYIFILPALLLELAFAGLRIWIEAPQKKSEIIVLGIETGMIIAGYMFMFLCLDAGVNTIFISTIVFVFLVVLAYDLTTVYLESKHEYLQEEVDTDYESVIKATRVRSERDEMIRQMQVESESQG